ncbi:MAG: tyrosine-type recombinase/integrase [Rubrivivax sp.]|nr:tyrosine-type recombinase/integrase [Rubrivivax sp.]
MADKLSDLKLRSLNKPGKHFDGQGLYLEWVAPGRGYWRLKFRFEGKEKRLAFGVYPEVSLKAARERRTEARAVLASGRDPSAVQKEARAVADRQAVVTFELVAREWLAHQSSRWADRTHAAILTGLEAQVFPVLGARPISQIKPREVMGIVKGVEARGAAETASRLLQRIKAVFRYAVVHERIESNPMVDLKPSELLKPRQVRHRAAMSAAELPAYLTTLDAYKGEPTTMGALRLLMLTAVRPGELRGALWGEIEEDAAVWRIPGPRMKMRAQHIVPLSRQALEQLQRMRAISGGGDLVFPSPFYPDMPLSENTLNSALARMGYKGLHSAHGFRSLFSTVANEHGHDADVIERQLAHAERNEVRAAYDRSEHLARRRILMDWWADWLDSRRPGPIAGA